GQLDIADARPIPADAHRAFPVGHLAHRPAVGAREKQLLVLHQRRDRQTLAVWQSQAPTRRIDAARMRAGPLANRLGEYAAWLQITHTAVGQHLGAVDT